MKLTALMENKGPSCLTAEHGLAVDIQYKGHHYLLDTGASDAFAANADRLGVDLSTVEMAFLSHGHFDHSGGYHAFFARNGHAPVYVRQGAQEAYYCGAGPLQKYIGVPKGLFEEFSDRFRFVEGQFQAAKGVWLLPDQVSDGAERGKKAHMSRKTEQAMFRMILAMNRAWCWKGSAAWWCSTAAVTAAWTPLWKGCGKPFRGKLFTRWWAAFT